jgi:hypothetical protein
MRDGGGAGIEEKTLVKGEGRAGLVFDRPLSER